MKTILVVDDEPKIAQIARDYLEHAGFAVMTAGDGQSALAQARTAKPDLIVLDLGLPEMDGLDVTRTLRRTSSVPIIMLTVRVVLRRAEQAAGTGAEIVRAGDLTLDMPRMKATVGGRNVELTPTEFQLLAALARQPGRIFTRAQLLDAVRGVAFESYERAIDAHIKNIRHKLEHNPRDPRYILTVYGVGYKFADR